MAQLSRSEFVSMVDHTLLAAVATEADVIELCAEAVQLGTRTVCVNGLWALRVAAELSSSAVDACVVVGFPLGAMSPASIAREAANAIDDGAAELDMVIPIGALIAGDDSVVAQQIAGVRAASAETTLKVIIESAVLDEQQILRVCRIASDAGADFVKTSTGFHAAGGATVEAVTTMRSAADRNVGVKASGGISDRATVEVMYDAGATRFGLSRTATIAAEFAD